MARRRSRQIRHRKKARGKAHHPHLGKAKGLGKVHPVLLLTKGRARARPRKLSPENQTSFRTHR